jgi:hypothetical protein
MEPDVQRRDGRRRIDLHCLGQNEPNRAAFTQVGTIFNVQKHSCSTIRALPRWSQESKVRITMTASDSGKPIPAF